MMAIVSGWLMVVNYRPNIVSFLISSAVFGIGYELRRGVYVFLKDFLSYGAYRAVDWALALDALPEGSQMAKDMGIWHVALVLPRVISPLISGFILRMYAEDKQTVCAIFSLLRIVVVESCKKGELYLNKRAITRKACQMRYARLPTKRPLWRAERTTVLCALRDSWLLCLFVFAYQ